MIPVSSCSKLRRERRKSKRDYLVNRKEGALMRMKRTIKKVQMVRTIIKSTAIIFHQLDQKGLIVLAILPGCNVVWLLFDDPSRPEIIFSIAVSSAIAFVINFTIMIKELIKLAVASQSEKELLCRSSSVPPVKGN
jgi:hypothetical protein